MDVKDYQIRGTVLHSLRPDVKAYTKCRAMANQAHSILIDHQLTNYSRARIAHLLTVVMMRMNKYYLIPGLGRMKVDFSDSCQQLGNTGRTSILQSPDCTGVGSKCISSHCMWMKVYFLAVDVTD